MNIGYLKIPLILVILVLLAGIRPSETLEESFEPDRDNLVKTEKFDSEDIDLYFKRDRVGGLNVRVKVDGFNYSPRYVNQYHRDGLGHAHVYVDGKKVGRMYSPHYYIQKLPDEDFELAVTINANDHRTYYNDGVVVETVNYETEK